MIGKLVSTIPVEDPSRWPWILTRLETGFALRINEDHDEAEDIIRAVMTRKLKYGLRAMAGYKSTKFSRAAVLEHIEQTDIGDSEATEAGGDSGSTEEAES